MKKITFSLGLAASLIIAGQTLADNDDDNNRFVVRDVWTQKVHLADEADTDGDGKISREEYLSSPGHRFDELDANGNGYIDREERNNSGFAMRSELEWDREAHDRMLADLDEELARVDEHLGRALERLEDMPFVWEGVPEVDDFVFEFDSYHGGDNRFFGFGWMGRELMDSLDDDDDGEVSREEFVNRRERLFDRLDDNEDGILDQDELDDLGMDGSWAFEFHSEDED